MFSLLSLFFNPVIPNIYFICLLIFLIPFSILITLQIYQLVQFELVFYRYKDRNPDDYSIDELFNLLKVLIYKKLWFLSISLLESKKNIPNESIAQYFNALGFLYYRMHKYDIAELYYLKALDVKENYIIVLQNLIQIYNIKRCDNLVLSTCKSLLSYDVNNKIAHKYIKNLCNN